MIAKTMTIRLFYTLTALTLLALIASCGQSASESAPANSSKEAKKDGDTSSAAGATSSGKIKIKTPDDRTLVEFKSDGENLSIEFSSDGQVKSLRGELKESGKRKYALEGGGQVAEVKADEKAFKVRTADGRLLWKVKLAEDKIKISDNEEGLNPFVLDIKSDDRIKVLRDAEEIGKVNFYRDRAKVKVKDARDAELFDSNTDRYSAMYGVLLMDRIPETERYIIMAEILHRGR
ncbi:MAG: hypothetical protein L0229_20915 [Blastocatellia bacterium]|nr:hypothetical protein [Blastocatellia bacterium]